MLRLRAFFTKGSYPREIVSIRRSMSRIATRVSRTVIRLFPLLEIRDRVGPAACPATESMDDFYHHRSVRSCATCSRCETGVKNAESFIPRNVEERKRDNNENEAQEYITNYAVSSYFGGRSPAGARTREMFAGSIPANCR